MKKRPTNADIMAELVKINVRLDKGDERFRQLDGVQEAAATLEMVAQTWKLASLGGRIVKWVASVAAAIGALWIFFKDGPKL